MTDISFEQFQQYMDSREPNTPFQIQDAINTERHVSIRKNIRVNQTSKKIS